MRMFFYIIVTGIIFSCVSGDYASYSRTSIRGKPIRGITIYEYSTSDLKSSEYYGLVPPTSPLNVYFLESEYFDRRIENDYEKLWEKYQNNARFLEDSLTKLYPKKEQIKEVNLLTNTTLEFRKIIDENIDNFSASEESYTLKDIIKPNRYYKIMWGKGRKDTYFYDGPHGSGYLSINWLELLVNKKRKITYWKEIDMKTYNGNVSP